MPTAPISMRKLKEILRLKYGCSLSHRQIASSLSISASVVSRYATHADAILDRLVHGSIKIELKGESMRKKAKSLMDADHLS